MEYIIKPYSKLTENPQNTIYDRHIHRFYEIFLLYSGEVDGYIEGNCYHLREGDLVLMRKGESHQMILKNTSVYGRIVVNFDLPFLKQFDPENRLLTMFEERPLGKYNLYSASMFPGNNWRYYLNKIEKSEQCQYQLVYLLTLLAELSECFKVVKNIEQKPGNDPISAIIRYINQNLCNDLSLSFLCEKFYLSKVHLNRIFKQSTGTTAWNYIVAKRLVLAHEMLMNGKAPTEVFMKCGFKDYSTFYRAYKKKFGCSPKQEQSR